MEPTQKPQPTTPNSTPSSPMEAGSQDPSMMGAPAPIQDGSPYFMGDHAIVRFSPDGPLWLVDKETRTIAPFTSPLAVQAVFGEDMQSIMESIVDVAPPNVAQDGLVTGGVFNGFYVLGPEYAIQDDGSGKKQEFSPSHLSERYGRPVDEDLEMESMMKLEELLGKVREQGATIGMPSNYVDKLMRDHKLMAFYLNALTYGDYDEQDIYLDVLKKYKDTQKGK